LLGDENVRRFAAFVRDAPRELDAIAETRTARAGSRIDDDGD